ncbi:c-type cytochrome [Pararhizobium sp. IMCC21322]|uniref:c-type cytochrome n=1 Tax=Pararhizobium sp. IMCC21322 TaxID=3067903 RepID=UPI002741ADA4|nr:c-type cytochrome [Pararhizobium sp. IMCC21322]
MKIMKLTIAAALLPFTLPVAAQQQGSTIGMNNGMMAEGLMMPEMDAGKGRTLFAEKGCVVCHSINDVGGQDAAMLDAEFMEMPMNPFEFAARMWRGAGAMVALQEEELGGQIELTGEELAHIIAFVHDQSEQAEFSEADIPEAVKGMMHHETEDDHHEGGPEDDHG